MLMMALALAHKLGCDLAPRNRLIRQLCMQAYLATLQTPGSRGRSSTTLGVQQVETLDTVNTILYLSLNLSSWVKLDK